MTKTGAGPILYKDRMEVENPGGIYGRLTIDELGKTAADTRNPYIAGCMEVLQETENRFSGIPTIAAEMEKAGLPPAVFQSKRGMFKVTLYNARKGKSGQDFELLPQPMRRILEYCSQPRSREEIAKLLNIATPSYVVIKYVRPLLEMGKLQMTLPQTPKSKKQKYVTVIER